MTHSRSLLLNGLSLLLRRLPAVLWTWLFGIVIAALFALRLHTQTSSLLDHSLASASLTRGFDLTVVAGGLLRLTQNVPGGSPFTFAGAPVFLILYFILVPGALFCYLTGERARLSTMLRQGLLHFWRFIRITIVAAIVFGIILGPLSALNTRWGSFVEDHVVGRPGFLLSVLGTLVLYLIASLIRLFFDLVEVYTVQLGLILRPNGRPDRRVRRAFAPAWRALRHNLVRAWGGFLLLALLGFAGFALLGRTAIHNLAQPRVWPLFLFSQLAVLLSIATRFWQRGAEVTLAQDHPLPRVVDIPSRSAFVPRAAPAAPVSTVLVPAAPIATAPIATAPIATAPIVPAYSTPVVPATPLASPAPPPPEPPTIAPPAPIAPAAQPLTPPGDLPPEQVIEPAPILPPATPAAPPPREEPRVPDPPAPVRTVYDIDPLAPLSSPPNPLPTEEEESLPYRPRDPHER